MSESPIKPLWNRLNNSTLVRYLLLIALGWVIAQILAYFEHVIVTFIFAAVFAFLLSYPVRWVERFLPHTVAVVIVFLLSIFLLLAIVFTIGLAILSQGEQLLNQAPELLNSVLPVVEQIEQLLQRFNFQVDFNAIEEQIRNQALAGLGFGFAALQAIVTNIVDLVIIAVIALFMLLDGKRLWYFLLQVFPQRFRDKLTHAVQHNFLGFFWGRFLLSLFFGVSVYVVLLLLQAPFALLLAAIAGVFDLIPGIGATIGVGLVSIILLPQGVWLSLQVLIGCVLLQQVEENVLMPKIMQGSLNVNPVVMFFALLVGARIAGLVGVFLSVPIAGVLISLFELNQLKAEHKDENSVNG
ncbi:AI-2E family transporter [Chroogloeocystis siderophila]|jgi:predicted PurR-regulated permease PerM|uniref:AI-2E family transporter n=1 Tax=Chroogloeocystis siderophila 5.2 s.c.1 TaxID=247279 RepID=A0A1U7HHQ9_9CHRO|nr:AI-2E family transporter [Chroogloeocystis siderophila]OKH23107.1 AI-2E family transporter [Chroogloeocystis siderophila 5.2 s.c.1]